MKFLISRLEVNQKEDYPGWAWPSQASPFKGALPGLQTPAAAGLHSLFFTGFCFPGGSDSKESACNAGDACLIPGLGRSHGEGNGHPLQYPCLGNPMDGGAWRATAGVIESNTNTTKQLTHAGSRDRSLLMLSPS